MFLIGAIVLLVLLVSTVSALVRPSGSRVITALAATVLWPFVNLRWEGPVLWVPLPGHGLTLGDLVTPVAITSLAIRWITLRHIAKSAA